MQNKRKRKRIAFICVNWKKQKEENEHIQNFHFLYQSYKAITKAKFNYFEYKVEH